MFEGMSVLRKEEKARAGRSEKAKELEEYLQNKYTGRKDKSKKTKKKKSSPRNITIRDMDVSGFATVAPCQASDGEEQDDAPVIANPEEAELLKRQAEKGGVMPPGHHKRRHDSPDQSPPRKRGVRHDSPDLSPPRRKGGKTESPDLSPPRRKGGRHDSPDLSPPRKKGGRHPSPDLSPPRRRGIRHDSSSLSPPRQKRGTQEAQGLHSPRKQNRRSHDSLNSSPPITKDHRGGRRHGSPGHAAKKHDFGNPDVVPGWKRRDRGDGEQQARRQQDTSDKAAARQVPKRGVAMADGTTAGMVSGQLLKQEMERKRLEDKRRIMSLDAGKTGEGAGTIYRDEHGRRMTLEELKEKRAKEQKRKEEEEHAPWAGGLVQQRELQQRKEEMQKEVAKPLGWSRDDADLDAMLRAKTRWGDPMAHLTKRKKLTDHELAPPVINDSNRHMFNKSGFVVPQDVPAYSWLKRKIAPPTNRYDIRPGRHWDGVDRTNGFEKDFIRHQNEKKAQEKEAMMWSMEDM